MIRLGERPTSDPIPTIDSTDGPTGAARVMALLRARVPLTLLLDLVDADGPDSWTILVAELVEDDVRRDRAALSDSATDFPADQDVC